MFNSFKRKLPEISIFHNPSSPPSTKALNLLRSSISAAYPPENKDAPPLQFDLQVVEATPTSDQLKTILSYLPSKAASPSNTFISAHPSAPPASERPESTAGIVELGRKSPLAIKWPIVVDWNNGKASIGDVDGVKGILEHLRKKRDGELKEEEVHQPKGWFT